MLVYENCHVRGLPLNRCGGELYEEDAIARDALICQELSDRAGLTLCRKV
jgi:hypothetical protein